MQNIHLTSVNPVYHKGNLSLCDNNWHYENIITGCAQLFYIIEGECVIEINGNSHIAKPGQFFFIPSHSTRTLYTKKDKTVKKYWIHCSLNCGDKNFSDLINLPFFIEVKACDNEIVENLFKNILAKNNDTSLVSKLEQKAEIIKLLAYYVQNSENSQTNFDYDDKITFIINYIENNLTSNLTLKNISEMLHFNPSYFIRYFKAVTGFTPTAYINNKRIILARKLLIDPKIPIQDIGAKVGFQSPHYFSRYFKKKTGLTPSQYRRYTINTYKVK